MTFNALQLHPTPFTVGKLYPLPSQSLDVINHCELTFNTPHLHPTPFTVGKLYTCFSQSLDDINHYEMTWEGEGGILPLD